jgi:nucleoside-diphosphate-sugar epimerase
MESKKILITGATGFLGSHLLKGLLAKTKFRVIVLKRTFSNTYRIKEELTNKRVLSYDIDRIKLETIFNKNSTIHSIIHCATEYGKGNKTCYDVLKINLMFPIKLLEFAMKNKVKLFINTDSYFNKENLSYQYLLNYSLSKKSLILWLKYFSNKIKIVNMVLEHIYGEKDNKDKFVSQMIEQIAVKKIDTLSLTAGNQKRDFVYIADVVNAYIKVLNYSLKNKFNFKSFDVGCGKAVSIKNFVKKIKEISKSSTILNFGALPYREDEIKLSIADNKDLINLGWEPKVSIEDGLKRTIDDEIKNAPNIRIILTTCNQR